MDVLFPTKRLNPVAGTLKTFLRSNLSCACFQQSDLTQSPGQGGVLPPNIGFPRFPTKRLNPVAGTKSKEKLLINLFKTRFQQSDLTQSPGLLQF